MYQVLIVAYLLVALALIGLVLIQQGKGADMGASFGAGASNTVFGSSGAGNFLTRGTAILATTFIIISLVLGNLSANQGKSTDKWSNLGAEGEQAQVAAQLPAGEKDLNAELPVDTEAETVKTEKTELEKVVNEDMPVTESSEKEAEIKAEGETETELPK